MTQPVLDGKDRVLRRKLCPTRDNGCQAERLPLTTVRILDAWFGLAWAVTKGGGACGMLFLATSPCVPSVCGFSGCSGLECCVAPLLRRCCARLSSDGLVLHGARGCIEGGLIGHEVVLDKRDGLCNRGGATSVECIPRHL